MKAKLLLILAIIAGFLMWHGLFDDFKSYVENPSLTTLEAKYTPQEIMEGHKQELIGASRRTFNEPKIIFQPYLLLEVKYTDKDGTHQATHQATREGPLLWSLLDGEMVLNADTWEKTHGFRDAIDKSATREDFVLLNLLAASKGEMTRDRLQKELKLAPPALDTFIDKVKAKHLITLKGSSLKLHFQNPRFLVTPETKMKAPLVTKAVSGNKIARKYSRPQIEAISAAAFGEDFSIRSAKEVFLPVIQITLTNPDGSELTTYWNALTGEKMKGLWHY